MVLYNSYYYDYYSYNKNLHSNTTAFTLFEVFDK